MHTQPTSRRLRAAPGSRIDRLHQVQQYLRALKAQGYQLRWIAAQLKVSQSLLSSWRAGKSTPRPEHVADLCRLAQNCLA